MTANKQLTGNQVRQMFLDFFASKGSMIEPGASLIPHNDPTLLWINAGVSALKKYFDGTEKPKCNRICNAQKSIRTNDIENVGNTVSSTIPIGLCLAIEDGSLKAGMKVLSVAQGLGYTWGGMVLFF